MADSKAQKKVGWRFRVNLGPLSLFLWGVFILFFMSWIFVLGIFVGRGFVPDEITDLSEIKGEIIKLKSPIEKATPEGPSGAHPDAEKETEPELVFYERLTSKKEDAKNNLHIGQTEAGGTASQTPAPSDRASAGDTAKPSVGSTVKSGSEQYTVQVASISELGNAEKTVKDLLEKGFDAYYYETTVKGKKYYRVRCGRFSDKTQAQAYSTRLEEKTGLKGYVTNVE